MRHRRFCRFKSRQNHVLGLFRIYLQAYTSVLLFLLIRILKAWEARGCGGSGGRNAFCFFPLHQTFVPELCASEKIAQYSKQTSIQDLSCSYQYQHRGQGYAALGSKHKCHVRATSHITLKYVWNKLHDQQEYLIRVIIMMSPIPKYKEGKLHESTGQSQLSLPTRQMYCCNRGEIPSGDSPYLLPYM